MLTVEVQVDPVFSRYVDVHQVQDIVHTVLAQEGPPTPDSRPREPEGLQELTVVITDEQRVQALNRRYRGIDALTDVLAFGGEAEGFVQAPEAPFYLGDIVISYPHVLAQAQEHGHSPEKELALLIIHGVLHLLGYDHATPQDKATMWARQRAILRQLGLD